MGLMSSCYSSFIFFQSTRRGENWTNSFIRSYRLFLLTVWHLSFRLELIQRETRGKEGREGGGRESGERN